MIFLGKYKFRSGDKYLVVNGGLLTMGVVSPTDPAAIFLAYDQGNNQFTLQSSNGEWVVLIARKSEIAFYPVLVFAGTGEFATSFYLPLFQPRPASAKFAWIDGEGDKVTLKIEGSINPNCNCVFDTANGWDFGSYFTVEKLAPGITEMQQTKQARGADFSCAGSACVNLAGADLSGVDLILAKFGGADLRGTKFEGANLGLATLVSAKVDDKTNFKDAVMRSTNFSGLDLTNNRNFSDPPDFTRETTLRTRFTRAKIEASVIGKDWSYLDLGNATMLNLPKDLRKLNAEKALLSGVKLGVNNEAEEPFNLEEANFYLCDMTGAQLQRANLTSAVLDAVHLANSNLTRADLTGAQVSGANLGRSGSQPAANLSEATILRTNFSTTYLHGVRFDRATIGYEANFHLATLDDASFIEADLAGQSLKDCSAQRSIFTRANLTNCDLRGTRFKALPEQPAEEETNEADDRANFDQACLLGADLTNATLKNANLVNAVVAFAPGYLYRQDSAPLPYKETTLPENITDVHTTCPSDEPGPCVGPKLSYLQLPANMAEIRNSHGELLGYRWSMNPLPPDTLDEDVELQEAMTSATVSNQDQSTSAS